MEGEDLFTGVAAAEIAAATTLTGYGVAMVHYAFPRAPRWVLLLIAIVLGQGASLLVMLMQTHEPTVEHLSLHVTVGILATAAAVGLRRAHGFIESRRAPVIVDEETGCGRTKDGDTPV